MKTQKIKFDTKTEARLRILRNAAEVCRLIAREPTKSDIWMYWQDLRMDLNKAADTIEREASDD